MTDWILTWMIIGIIGGALCVGAAVIIVLGGLTISWFNRRHDEVHRENPGTHTGAGEEQV